MTATIRQKNRYPASPATLYRLFLDPKAHAAFTAHPARISARPSAPFRTVDYATGKNLSLTPGGQIVQSWRADDWKKGDPDSVLILNFTKDGKGGAIEMIHAGVPDRQRAALASGWADFYWKPLREFLKSIAP